MCGGGVGGGVGRGTVVNYNCFRVGHMETGDTDQTIEYLGKEHPEIIRGPPLAKAENIHDQSRKMCDELELSESMQSMNSKTSV